MFKITTKVTGPKDLMLPVKCPCRASASATQPRPRATVDAARSTSPHTIKCWRTTSTP